MSSRDWSFFLKNPHVICFIISAVLLLATFLNLHSAGLSEDYIQTTGEIMNVEEDMKIVHGTRRMYYDFDVSWEMGGQYYEKHFDDQLDYEPEGQVTIWVSPDNSKVRFASGQEVYESAPLDLALGVVSGILGFVLWKRKSRKRRYMSKAEKMDHLENLQIGSAIGLFCFLTGAGFIGYDMYKEYRELMAFEPLTVDLMVIVGAGMLVCAGMFVYATVKSKQ
ncbi:MAG: hypothetical protein E7289_03440 [Lachnospiraceae bacterium]|nr:hypothetical protein [Lachnospiraceae bacterium]